MDIHQVHYFLHLAETLNFTTAALRCGVSQPSLTRGVRRLEEELGGALIYRDGKDSRLTPLGREVQIQFRTIKSAIEKVRSEAESSRHHRRCVVDIGISATLGTTTFLPFIDAVLDKMPNVIVTLRQTSLADGVDQILAGGMHACVLPRPPKDNPKLRVVPLFTERYVLACRAGHPLATKSSIETIDLTPYQFIDRAACEFRDDIADHFTKVGALPRSRIGMEREDSLQQALEGSERVCIVPERSITLPGLVTRPLADLKLIRQIVLVTISGSGTPREVRDTAALASSYDWLNTSAI